MSPSEVEMLERMCKASLRKKTFGRKSADAAPEPPAPPPKRVIHEGHPFGGLSGRGLPELPSAPSPQPSRRHTEDGVLSATNVMLTVLVLTGIAILAFLAITEHWSA